MPQARPLTLNEWRRTSAANRGGWSYGKYRKWWFKTVAPRVGRNATRVGTYDPLAPLTESALQNIAEREVGGTLTEQRTELEKIRKSQAAQYAARAKDIAGFGLAGAESLKSIGPQIQAGYAGAAGETASFAKGFADANNQLSAASAQGANELLAQVGPQGGAPAGQVSAINAAAGQGALGGGTAGAALHDVTYAQGEIPAAGLAREGAAFGAAAGFLPGAMLGLTNAEMMKANQQAADVDQEFVDKLVDLEKSRPDLVAKIMESLRDNELQKVATAINREYLGLKGTQMKLDAKAAATKAGLDASTVNEQLSAGNGFLTNDQGQAILDHGKKVPYKPYVKPKAPPKPGTGPKAKFNDKLATKKSQMFTDVTENFTTTRTANYQDAIKRGDPNIIGKKITESKYSYQKAYQILWDKYGQGLMGYAGQGNKAAYKAQVVAAINQALAQIGLKKKAPPKKKPAKKGPKSGSLFGTNTPGGLGR